MSQLESGQGVEDAEVFHALAKSEEMYRAVFENTGTGTIIIDYDMTILYVNAHFESMTGYNRSEIENSMKWSQFVATDDLDRMQRYHYGRNLASRIRPVFDPGTIVTLPRTVTHYVVTEYVMVSLKGKTT